MKSLDSVEGGIAPVVRFGGYELDACRRELRDEAGIRVPLTSKAFDTLAVLVGARGRTLDKRTLIAQVWPGRVVEDNNLNQAIVALRRVFGTHGDDHAFIVTVPGQGYRFVAEVDEVRRDVAVSLAVLPLRLHGGLDDVVLELGLAETLIAALAQRLRVPVRSMAAVQGVRPNMDSAEAGRRLGVSHVLEGSVQPTADGLHVTLRLLASRDGVALWSQLHDVDQAEVPALHEAVVEDIAHALAADNVGETTPLPKVDRRAFRAYIVGRYLVHRPDPSRLPDAIAALRDAIDLDPAYARAYAAMAFAYRAWCITGDRAPLEVFPLARAAAAQALLIDPALADAHAQKGFIEFWHEWDWKAAESTLQHAIALDPNLAEARIAHAHLLNNLRRFDEAITEIVRARELDPLSPLIVSLHAGFLGYAGRLDQALRSARAAVEFAPRFAPARLHLGQVLFDRGDYGGAVETLEACQRMTTSSQVEAMLGVAYAADGRRHDAEGVLERLRTSAARGYVPPTSLAATEAWLGRTDHALDLLEAAERVRDVRLTFLAVDTRWQPLQDLPRFVALARRLDLPVPSNLRGDAVAAP